MFVYQFTDFIAPEQKEMIHVSNVELLMTEERKQFSFTYLQDSYSSLILKFKFCILLNPFLGFWKKVLGAFAVSQEEDFCEPSRTFIWTWPECSHIYLRVLLVYFLFSV